MRQLVASAWQRAAVAIPGGSPLAVVAAALSPRCRQIIMTGFALVFESQTMRDLCDFRAQLPRQEQLRCYLLVSCLVLYLPPKRNCNTVVLSPHLLLLLRRRCCCCHCFLCVLSFRICVAEEPFKQPLRASAGPCHTLSAAAASQRRRH